MILSSSNKLESKCCKITVKFKISIWFKLCGKNLIRCTWTTACFTSIYIYFYIYKYLADGRWRSFLCCRWLLRRTFLEFLTCHHLSPLFWITPNMEFWWIIMIYMVNKLVFISCFSTLLKHSLYNLCHSPSHTGTVFLWMHTSNC